MKSLFFFITLCLASVSLAQSTVHTIIHNEVEREYRLYVPDIYSGDEPVPLVFNLHGYGSSAIEQEFYGNFRPIADTANFILVHPEGLNDFGSGQFWNAFGVPGIDDVGFIAAMIDSLSAEYNIDTQCVYSTGMSNGGFMSFELACSLSNRIAAVASVTGSMAESRLAVCDPEFARPVMQIHGTADQTVPYNGNGTFASIPAVIDFWVALNECDETPQISTVADSDPDDGTTSERFLYEVGINGNTVEHFKVENGGHTWPGSLIEIGVTSQDFNASEEIWRFFRQFKLDAPTSVLDIAFQPQLKIYPNPSSGEVFVDCDAQINQIRIIDMTGRLVNQLRVQSMTAQLQLKEKGIFIMEINTDSGTVFQKLVLR